jgi:hypothetical protein
MYFTRSALYALPYYATRTDPVVFICLVVPGNPYPVVEDPSDAKSFLAKPIKGGYQSHYVLTTKDGKPCKRKLQDGKFFDEVVIDQESQVIPIYLLRFNQPDLLKISVSFARDVVNPGDVPLHLDSGKGKKISERRHTKAQLADKSLDSSKDSTARHYPEDSVSMESVNESKDSEETKDSSDSANASVDTSNE